MSIVILTALGVGGATVFGGFLGLVFKKISSDWNDAILAFAAGVMLASSVLGLILPAFEYLEDGRIFPVIASILLGGLTIHLIDRLIPHMCGVARENYECSSGRKRVFFFVLAIAIHNLPEGIAAGVGFGTGDITAGILIAAGIALQNIPEGMVVILPMISVGISPKKSFLIAALTGVVEIVGTILGYFVVNVVFAILPLGLAFAGGCMLWVVNGEMIPETQSGNNPTFSAFATLFGFAIMLLFDRLL